MPIDLIPYDASLRKGTDLLNEAIKQANASELVRQQAMEAIALTEQATSKANTAARNADSKAAAVTAAGESATNAASSANSAAGSANEKAGLAAGAAQAANTAAGNANEKAGLANTAAGNANTAAGAANTAAGSANTAAGRADAVAVKADAAASTANTATSQANNARDAANESAGKANTAAGHANEQGNYAKEQGDTQNQQLTTVAEVLEEIQDDFLPGIAGSVAETDRYMRSELSEFQKRYAKVYGIVHDKVTDTVSRTGDSVGMTAGVGVGDQLVRNDFDSAQIYRDIKTIEDAYGNRFRRIPRHYIRKKDTPAIYSKEISYVQLEGFYRPALFWDFENNVELDYYDHPIHLGSEDENGRLESKPGRYPLTSIHIVEAREKAVANNSEEESGYQQLDVHAMDVLTTLIHIEFATLHSQSVMAGWTSGRYSASDLVAVTESNTNRVIVPKTTGNLYAVGQPIGVGTSQGGNQVFYGREITAIEEYDADHSAVLFDGDPVDIVSGNFLYNIGWKTGFSEQIAASSGSIGDNTSGKYPCMYRGIESPWGDVYQFVDGVNISDRQAWVAKDARDYASNVFMEPYEQLSYVNSADNGYPKEMGYDANLPFANFPTIVGANSATYYADYYYQNTGARIARVGGVWSNGVIAGLSCWDLSNSSGARHVALGARLLKKAS